MRHAIDNPNYHRPVRTCRRCVLLALLALLTGGPAGLLPADAARRAPPPKRQAAKANDSPAEPLSWTVLSGSFHKTREDAWQDAVERARDQLGYTARRVYPDLNWSPSPLFVQRLIKREEDEERTFDKFEEELGTMRKVRLHIELSDRDYQDLLRQARRAVAVGRMRWLALILGAVVLGLTSVAGYARLEEWTKGYFTTWLRLGAGGALAAVVVAATLFVMGFSIRTWANLVAAGALAAVVIAVFLLVMPRRQANP